MPMASFKDPHQPNRPAGGLGLRALRAPGLVAAALGAALFTSDRSANTPMPRLVEPPPGRGSAVGASKADLSWDGISKLSPFLSAQSDSPSSIRLERLINTRCDLTLPRLEGRAVLLYFWGSYCLPCLQSFPFLQELEEKYGERGLVTVAITDESAERVRTAGRAPQCIIGTGGKKVREFFGFGAIPAYVVFGPDGCEISRLISPEHKEVDAAIVKALAQQDRTTQVVQFKEMGQSCGAPAPTARAELDRPASAQGWDQAGLSALKRELSKALKDASPAQPLLITQTQLENLSSFYWNNLPNGSWPGDLRTREEAARAAISLIGSPRVAQASQQALLEAALEQIQFGDPNASLRAERALQLAFRLEGQEAGRRQAATKVFGETLAEESDPLVRCNFEQSLEVLKKNCVEARPPTMIDTISAKYREELKSQSLSESAKRHDQIRSLAAEFVKLDAIEIKDLRVLLEAAGFDRPPAQAVSDESGWAVFDRWTILMALLGQVQQASQEAGSEVGQVVVSDPAKNTLAEFAAKTYLSEGRSDWFYGYTLLNLLNSVGVRRLSTAESEPLMNFLGQNVAQEDALYWMQRLVQLQLERPKEGYFND
jgi:cytochrome c biogenesis protein CcmG, thiol:disulfide interchange protein DsbE